MATASKDNEFDVAILINYYAPYVSGLTIHTQRLAEGLAERGKRVAVVAVQHDRSLPLREVRAGVSVFRSPVLRTIGRGPVSPGFVSLARRIARRSAIVNPHVPMLEVAPIAMGVRGRPLVTTHHIDLWLPPGVVNAVATRAVDVSTWAALRRSDAVVLNSTDQARGSKLWPLIKRRNWRGIAPPCLDRRGGQPAYRDGGGLHVGFLGRIVEDKGIEYLVRAFQRLDDPDARLLIGGDWIKVAGGGIEDRLRPLIGDDKRIRMLGLLSGSQIDDFYASIDVFALPSVAESFGTVQAEAMMTDVPSVTTDLPGGRSPVLQTGFGRRVPPRDPARLARAITELAALTPDERAEGGRRARRLYSTDTFLDAYEELFDQVTPMADNSSAIGAPRPSTLVK
ncbi:glycosyltransferase family 4 protein [Nonomuraea sp. MG754425]|uniref:glycosyltransferase family 4 protein n=1 Tax=Nonomuraea sp. MG754425 TaxID=2570319 RepID=UPI001F1844C8|nr:glycosyltransferase family 4 protein [Nonomuraea sp. MG754425]MCF6468340.1 glycosyltransferase family 4 protein [Nonomuraea sp. MG754425]